MIERYEAARDPIFDPYAAVSVHDPYPSYRVLRDEHPVYYVAARDVWVISRYADIQSVARDWQGFANTPSVDLDDTTDIYGPGVFIDMDPPRHDVLRDVVRKRFTPRDINATWPTVLAAEVEELIGGVREAGETDLARELAWPLPVAMLCRLIGFPAEDRETLMLLFERLITREAGKREAPEASRRSALELRDYFAGVIAERKRRPKDDLISQILAATADGTINEDEVIGLCFLMCDAGTSTTASLIGNSFALLAENPDQRAVLVEHPDRLPAAIEEILRYEAPVQYLARRTTKDVELHGVSIPAESRVVLLYGAANRDERRFERPDALDLSRETKRHLTFGEGIHFCLGAPLARMESRIMLEQFLREFPEYELSGKPRRTATHALRGFATLPAVLS